MFAIVCPAVVLSGCSSNSKPSGNSSLANLGTVAPYGLNSTVGSASDGFTVKMPNGSQTSSKQTTFQNQPVIVKNITATSADSHYYYIVTQESIPPGLQSDVSNNLSGSLGGVVTSEISAAGGGSANKATFSSGTFNGVQAVTGAENGTQSGNIEVMAFYKNGTIYALSVASDKAPDPAFSAFTDSFSFIS